MKIRVYIYTAVNGYSWQGCDKELAKSLDICLGSSWKTAAPNGSSAMGGIRRGEVGGLNGTAIFRVHVRRNGDFAGRDSDYVALAFLPFAQIGERFVDYTGLWNHRLLAAPLERGVELSGLEIDLEKEGMLSATTPMNSPNAEDYWTIDGTPLDHAVGTADDILARLGATFQSRKSELGSFSASIFIDCGGRVFVQSRYKPFSSVKEEHEAHKAFEEARRTGDEAGKAAAYKRWGEAVNALVALADGRTGQFRHFLGLCQYAREETEAFSAGTDIMEQHRVAMRSLDNATGILEAVGTRLTGEETGAIVALEGIARSLRPFIEQMPNGGDLRGRLQDLEAGIAAMKKESESVARWLLQPEGTLEPRHISPALLSMAKRLDRVQADARSSQKRAEKSEGEVRKLAAEVERLQKALRKSGGLADHAFSPDDQYPFPWKTFGKWLLPMAAAVLAAILAMLVLLKTPGCSRSNVKGKGKSPQVKIERPVEQAETDHAKPDKKNRHWWNLWK